MRPLAFAGGGEAVASEGAVRVDGMRHDRRAENGCREQHRTAVLEPRHEAGDDSGRIGRRDDHAIGEADRDDREQADDDELEGARSAPGLDEQQDDGDGACDDPTDQEGKVEQQVERDGAADHLCDVGRHGDEFGLQPVRPAGPSVADAVAQCLGQAAARDDPELRREVLDQPRHDIAEHHDPHEQVAVRRAGGHVARHIAGVEVRDPCDEGRSDEPRDARESRPAPRGGRGVVPVACAVADFGIPKRYSGREGDGRLAGCLAGVGEPTAPVMEDAERSLGR